jgi:hypothetical protein
VGGVAVDCGVLTIATDVFKGLAILIGMGGSGVPFADSGDVIEGALRYIE